MIQITFLNSVTGSTATKGPFPSVRQDPHGWLYAPGPPELKIAERTVDGYLITRDAAGLRNGLFDSFTVDPVDIRTRPRADSNERTEFKNPLPLDVERP